MRRLCLLVCVGLAIFGVPASAQAQDSIKVGVLTELSGPLGTLGIAERDGFLLYLKKAGGKLGGLTVETVVEDTGNDPATALVKARKLLDSDKSYLAGKAGFKKATAIAPDFNAGQDAVTWFEKGFEAAGGKVVQKLLPRLGTLDFGSYIAQIDDSADVGLVFMAGGDAVRFIKQFADYGKKLPLYGFTATVDEAILPAQGKAALGFVGASRSQQGAAGTCWHSGGPASCNLAQAAIHSGKQAGRRHYRHEAVSGTAR